LKYKFKSKNILSPKKNNEKSFVIIVLDMSGLFLLNISWCDGEFKATYVILW